MFYINSPLSQFEITNLIGIFTCNFSPFAFLLDSGLSLQNPIVDFFGLAFNFYFYCKDIFMVFFFVIFCGIVLTSVSYIIFYSGRKIIDKIINNGGGIGTGVVGFVTGLDATLNLVDRTKKARVLVDPVDQILIKINILIKTRTKIKKKKKIIKTLMKIIQKITNLKIYLNYLFYFFFIIFKNIFAVLTRYLFYFTYYTGTHKDNSKALVTNKYKCLYFLPFIFAKLNPNVTAEAEPLISYSFSMFILSLLVLICFVNIIGYMLSIYLISKYNVENKFPYFKRYIKFYSSTSKFLLILEIIMAFVFLIFILILNLFLFTKILTI